MARDGSEVPADRSHHLLLVEGEGVLREFIRGTLRAQGYVVRAVEGAAEGLRLLDDAQQGFDLLICDAAVPGADGRPLGDYARRVDPGIQVLLLIGETEKALAEREFETGGFELLPKPFTADALLRSVRRLLRIKEEK